MLASVRGDADLVVAFLNTLDLEGGTDELATASGWRAWAAARGLPAPGPLDAARAARDALRAAAGDGSAAPDVRVPVNVGIVDGRPRAMASDALGAVLLAAARVADAGAWARIKLCAAPGCRWAFVDESRNRSRAWCSMQVCGNRAKARAFRARAKSD